MLILTEMFCAAIFIAIYWTLCAYCEIISLLKLRKNVQKKLEIYVWCWSIMFCAAYYIARLWILFYGSKWILSWHFATNESGEKVKKWKNGEATHEIKCSRRFKIFVGSVMSDKNKRSFCFAGIGQQCRFVCLCLLFVVSDIFQVIV